jgi:tetratricopeptide (TPR) repeat protein
MQQLLQDRPTLVPLFTLILRRGDPLACRFVFSFAKDVGDSPLIEPLRRFALGQFGSQKLRSEVLSWLHGKGLLDGPIQRMWVGDEWHDIRLSEMEIYHQPEGRHSPEVDDLAGRAFELLHRNPREAERLLREALKLEPDAPDLLNNLAAALLGLGREDESQTIVQDVQRRFPDYFFGQVALAHEQIADGDIEAAKKTLGKLTQRSRLHVSEYAAMAECYIRIAVESEDVQDAQAWLQRIEDVDPDYHALGKIRQIIAHLAARSGAGATTKRDRFLGGLRAPWRR